jgi:hypothetical protein
LDSGPKKGAALIGAAAVLVAWTGPALPKERSLLDAQGPAARMEAGSETCLISTFRGAASSASAGRANAIATARTVQRLIVVPLS